MSPGGLNDMLSRIDRRLEHLQLSDRAVSIAAGLSPDAIRTIRRQSKAGTQRSITLKNLQALARALMTTTEWLQSGTGAEEIDPNASPMAAQELSVLGTVAAGRWLQIDSDAADAPLFDVHIAPDLSYPADQQYALAVEGTSINKVAHDGDFLICLDLEKAGLSPQNGDLVVVERLRDGLRETVAKRLFSLDGHIELRSDSTDPRYSDQAHPYYRPAIRYPTNHQPPDEQITIKAIVIRVWRNVERRTR